MILVRDRMGETTLYGPAPQTSYDEGRPEERLFTEVARTFDPDEIDKRLEREMRFDPDIWVIELEVDDGTFKELVSVRTL